jgi:hypothetical protein
MGSPTLQTLQDPILLLPWLCFRGGVSNPDSSVWFRAEQRSSDRRGWESVHGQPGGAGSELGCPARDTVEQRTGCASNAGSSPSRARAVVAYCSRTYQEGNAKRCVIQTSTQEPSPALAPGASAPAGALAGQGLSWVLDRRCVVQPGDRVRAKHSRKFSRLSSRGTHEHFVVLVTPYFRYLASAPQVHWQTGAGAPALGQEPEGCVTKPRTLAPLSGVSADPGRCASYRRTSCWSGSATQTARRRPARRTCTTRRRHAGVC